MVKDGKTIFSIFIIRKGGFVASMLEHYLKLDMKKWLKVIRDLELMPMFMQQDLSFIWLQKFHGNITIFVTSDFTSLISRNFLLEIL